MALMAGLDPAAAATVAGAAVLATPCKTAPLATPGPRVMVPAGWMIVLVASDLLAGTEAGVWFIKRGVVVVVEVVVAVVVIPGVATLATVAETVLILLLPLIVKHVPAVCIDALTTVTEGPALDAAAGGFPYEDCITVFGLGATVTFPSPFATPGPLLTTGTEAEASSDDDDGPLDTGVPLSVCGSIALPPFKVCTVDVPVKVVTIALRNTGSA